MDAIAAKDTDRLTVQQACFIRELLAGRTQREAYRVAYPKSSGASDKTIDERACKLFNRPKIKARYEQLRDVAVLDIEADGIASAQRVLQELANIAFANATYFAEVKESLGVVIKPTDSVDPDKRAAIAEISATQYGTRVKTYDKVKALELLGKHFKLFTDKVELDNPDGTFRIEVVRVDGAPPDE